MSDDRGFLRSLCQDFVLTLLVCAGIVGIIALLTYIRYAAVIVPVLIALAGAVVLLLIGYFFHRPLVRFGYILVWLAVWLAATSLVLRLFAFGELIGMLAAALWILLSGFGTVVFIMGGKTAFVASWNTQKQTEQRSAARVRAEQQEAAGPLEEIIARLPQVKHVDRGGGAFRVNRETFVYISPDAAVINVRLPKEEADAVVTTDPTVEPTRLLGLGNIGWIAVRIPAATDAQRWDQIEEWIRTSYILTAPKRLARAVREGDQPER